MYYEETFYQEDWWYRSSPDGAWYKFSREQLLVKIEELLNITKEYKKIQTEFLAAKTIH